MDPIAITVQDPANSGFERFVGLEHYDSNELVIKRFSGVELLTTNAKAFQKNDILIARRNVYLRRAGVVYFDGITSGDSIVLRVKEDCEKQTGISRELAQRILPLVLNTDKFWIYANKHADGMNSKRISKDTLLDYEFDLPSIEEQKVLADKLWAAYKVKESYRQLLSTTDEMLKAKFQEMFGDVVNSTIHNIAKVVSGKSIPTKLEDIVGPVAYVKVADFNLEGNEKYITTSSRFVTKENANLSKNVPIGSILFAKNGAAAMSNKKRLTKIDCCIDMNTLAVIPNKAKALPEFLLAFFESINIADHVRQGAIPSISPKDIENIALHLPPMELQQKFAEIATQAEATKASLRASIEAIDRVIKSLINQ